MEVVKLVPSLPRGGKQARRFENFKVLRDALPGGTYLVLHGQPGAKLKERLPIAFRKLVEDGAADGRSYGLENISHHSNNRQAAACLSRPGSEMQMT